MMYDFELVPGMMLGFEYLHDSIDYYFVINLLIFRIIILW